MTTHAAGQIVAGPTLASIAAAERCALAATLLSVGPTAPTLCRGWDARDICTHLVLFQRRPDTWFAVPLGNRLDRVRRYYDDVVDRERHRPWSALVDRFVDGPGHGPLANDARRDAMFFREYVVHHEDVRRANDLPVRQDVPALQHAVWGKLPAFARMVQPAGVGVSLRWPDRAVQTVRQGTPQVELSGEPVDLLLHLFGRRRARVELAGRKDVLARVTVRDTSGLAALPRIASS